MASTGRIDSSASLVVIVDTSSAIASTSIFFQDILEARSGGSNNIDIDIGVDEEVGPRSWPHQVYLARSSTDLGPRKDVSSWQSFAPISKSIFQNELRLPNVRSEVTHSKCRLIIPASQ